MERAILFMDTIFGYMVLFFIGNAVVMSLAIIIKEEFKQALYGKR